MKTTKKPSRSLRRRVGFVIRVLGPHARPQRGFLVYGSAAALGVVLCRLAFPWPLRGILEIALSDGDEGDVLSLLPSWGDPIAWLGGVFILLAICQGLAEYQQRVSFARFAVATIRGARAEAIRTVTKQGSSWNGDRTKAGTDLGDLIARIIGDSARIKAGVKGVLVHVTQNGLFFVGVCAMLIITDLLLGTVFLAGGVVAFTIAFRGTRRLSVIARKHRKKEGRLADLVHRTLSADDQSAEEMQKERDELSAINDKSSRSEVKISRIEARTTWAMHGAIAITGFLVLIIGLDGVSTGRLQPGDLFTVVAYLLMVHNPTVRLGRQTARLGRILASAERLARVLHPKKPKPAPHPTQLIGSTR